MNPFPSFRASRRIAFASAAACVYASILLSACGDHQQVAGGWIDTETGKKVSGVIKRDDGQPAAGALIQLRPSDYLGRDPSSEDTAGVSAAGGSRLDGVCDSTGYYSFDSVAVGSYSLEARNQEINAVLIKFEIRQEGHGVSLAPAIVRPVGSITGRVRFSDDVPGPALVRIRGLERAVLADPATGVYTFGNVPQGTYTLYFTGLEPLVSPQEKPGVSFTAGFGTNAGETVLQRGLRQAFQVTSSGLQINGLDSTNPVIIENGTFISPVDGAYLWAKASMGHLDLRGTIVSYGADTGDAAIRSNLANCGRLMKLARNSGMRMGPAPVAGARRKLERPRSGNLMDILPDSSEGCRLLIREARKATPAKPLVLISGANLTTAAQALLRDPSIADRMVVFGANNGNLNKDDSLALAVVSKKGRFVEWARDYYWANDLPREPDSAFPTHRLGLSLKWYFAPLAVHASWAYSFFADFGPATFLFRPQVWKDARTANLKAPPLVADLSVPAPYDFVDIPEAATDWNAIKDEFFSALNDPAAYHPWPIASGVEAEAYSASVNVKVDSNAVEQSEVATWNGTGTWAEYSVQVDSAGDYKLEIRSQSDSAAQLGLSDSPAGASGGAAGTPVMADLQAGPAWTNTMVTLHLEAGARILRVESRKGVFVLNRIRAIP